MSETGHIIGGPADPAWDGATLTTDVALGDSVLHVDDTADFDEDAGMHGGLVLFDVELDGYGVTSVGSSLGYTTCDDEAGTVTLAAVSTVTASAGDPLYVGNALTGLPVGVVEVMVAIDGSDTTGDPLPANLDLALLASVGVDVDLTDQAVQIDEDDDGQLWVVGFLGLAQVTGAVKFDQDETTAVGPGGVVTLDLKYIPEANSEHLYIGGVYQRGAVWTRDRWTVSIPDPDGELAAGNKIAMEYAYRDPTMKPPTVYSAPTWHQRAHTYNSLASSHITSQPLPVDAQLGDLLVVTGIGGGGCTLADPRLTTVAWILNGSTQILAVAVGYATTLEDLTVDVTGLALPLDQFGGVEVLAVRGDAGEGVAYDPTRIDSATSHTGPGSPLATVAGAGNGVIIATVAGWADPLTVNWATYVPDYDDWGGDGGTAVHSNFGYSADNSPPAQQNPFNIGLLAAVIGLK